MKPCMHAERRLTWATANPEKIDKYKRRGAINPELLKMGYLRDFGFMGS
jgi:hypothetical protein